MREDTVLSGLDDVAALLADAWGLQVDTVATLERGTAHCRVITTGGRRFVLKEYQRGVAADEIGREMAILAHLQADGLPVGRIVPTLSGAGATLHQGRVFQLQDKVEGEVFAKFGAPAWLSRALPRTLARIVHSLERYPRLPSGHLFWFKRDLRARAGLFADFARQAEEASWIGTNHRTLLAESARRRIHMIRTVAEWDLSTLAYTYANSHGDYSIEQVLCAEGKIAAIIDFARASHLPVAWEVFRSFTYLDAGCREGGIDLAALWDYLAAFDEVLPLSDVDRRHMAQLYAYQLAPSSMGFRQVLERETPDQGDLIAFACWRTDLCETLINRREEIAEALGE